MNTDKYIDQGKDAADRGRGTVEYIFEGLKSALKTGWRVAVYIVVAYSILLMMFVLVALGFLHLIGIETGVPTEIKPYTVIFGYVISILIVPAEYVRQWISDRYYELVHVTDPENGDAGFRKLSPPMWENLTVKTVHKNDDDKLVAEDKDKDWLHRSTVDTKKGARTGYEVEYYDDSTNTAYVSYFGGVTGTEIRRAGLPGVKQLKHEASVERERHERLRQNNDSIVEKEVYRRVNWIIHAIQGERVPEKPTLRDEIQKGVEEAELDDIVGPEGRHPSSEIEAENPFDQRRLSAVYGRGDDK